MGIVIDPKAGANVLGSENPAGDGQGDALDSSFIDNQNIDPPQARNALDILAGGLRRVIEQEQNYQSQIPPVPKLEKILDAAPSLGKRPGTLNQMRERFLLLQRNYEDRRYNYTQALEAGSLRVEEAMDIHMRIDELNEALFDITLLLDKISHQKRLVESRRQAVQWEEKMKRLEKQLADGDIDQAEFDRRTGIES